MTESEIRRIDYRERLRVSVRILARMDRGEATRSEVLLVNVTLQDALEKDAGRKEAYLPIK